MRYLFIYVWVCRTFTKALWLNADSFSSNYPFLKNAFDDG